MNHSRGNSGRAVAASELGFYSVIEYAVDGPATQRELVAAFAEVQQRWVRHYPGYRSARLLASVDGARVYTLVHWASEGDYQAFEEASDTEGRMAAIQAALDGLSGHAESRMSGPPRYAVLREVRPEPHGPIADAGD